MSFIHASRFALDIAETEKMKRALTASILAGFTVIGLIGCGTPEASTMLEDANQSEIQRYEAMIAADEDAMSADQGNETTQ